MTLNELTIALFWIVTASYAVYLAWSLYGIIRRALTPVSETARTDSV